jgi:hypothetical protein
MNRMHKTHTSCREKEVDIYTDPVCIVKVNVIITKILIQNDSRGLGPNLIITNNAIIY